MAIELDTQLPGRKAIFFASQPHPANVLGGEKCVTRLLTFACTISRTHQQAVAERTTSDV